MAGWVEGIRRALVLVLIAGSANEQAPSVGFRGLPGGVGGSGEQGDT